MSTGATVKVAAGDNSSDANLNTTQEQAPRKGTIMHGDVIVGKTGISVTANSLLLVYNIFCSC